MLAGQTVYFLATGDLLVSVRPKIHAVDQPVDLCNRRNDLIVQIRRF